MKYRFFSVLAAACVLCAFTVDAQAKVEMKAGAGISYGSEFGFAAHISKDIPAIREYMAISLFTDATMVPKSPWRPAVFVGAHIVRHWDDDGKARLYLGGGGGVAFFVSEGTSYLLTPVQSFEAIGVLSTLVGIDFGKVFVQAKFRSSMSEKYTTGYGIEAGLSF